MAYWTRIWKCNNCGSIMGANWRTRHICGQKLKRSIAPNEKINLTKEEIQELAQAKAEGRLVILPCKVGSDLWSIERARTKCTAHGEEYSEYSCQGCEEPCDSVITQKIRRVKEASHMTIAHFMQSGCFGKTVFLTREAAEKALKNNMLDI